MLSSESPESMRRGWHPGAVHRGANPCRLVPGGSRAHHRHLGAVGNPGPHASPVEGAIVGGQDCGPLARVPQEEAPPACTSRGGGKPVAPVEELIPAAQGREVGFDVGEP